MAVNDSRRSYDRAFKVEAVRLSREPGRTVAGTARDLGINENMLHRRRRVSEFDWTLLRKAASLNAPTDVALTFADYINQKNTMARRFEQLTAETIHFVEEVERVSGAPVSLISTRFHSRSIIDRRSW